MSRPPSASPNLVTPREPPRPAARTAVQPGWRLGAALYRLLASGAAVPRLLAVGLGCSAWLATMWALGWSQLPAVQLLTGLAAGLGLALIFLPRQLGMPWPLVAVGLALMWGAQQAVGLLPAVLAIFVLAGGLLAPHLSVHTRPPLVSLAWAVVSAAMLFVAMALLQWVARPPDLLLGAGLSATSALSTYLVLAYGLLSGLPGWCLSWAEQRFPLRPARWMAATRSLVWRAGMGLALYVVLTSQVDGMARGAWRLLQGSTLETWSGPIGWTLAAGPLAAAGVVVWRAPVWLARAQLRGWVSARAAGDALATGGMGGLLAWLVWILAQLGSSSHGGGGLLDAQIAVSEAYVSTVALLIALAVNVGVRLALGRPVATQTRSLWVVVPRPSGDGALPAVLRRRAHRLAHSWHLGPVTLVARAADARLLAGAHAVVAQEAGVAESLYTASSVGDEWQRQLPPAASWRALPLRCRFLTAPSAADWAEAARWVPPQASVVVLVEAAAASAEGWPGSSKAAGGPPGPALTGSSALPAQEAAAQALCRALPVDRSSVWSTGAAGDASASAPPGGTDSLPAAVDGALSWGRLPWQSTPADSRQEAAWVARLVDRARGQAAAQRRVLLLHAEQDAAFAGELLGALRRGRDEQGLPVVAAALAYPNDARDAAAQRGYMTGSFVSAVLRDGHLWDLLMADAVGLVRRTNEGRNTLKSWLTTLGLELARDGRRLDVLVLESGLPDAAARANMPDRSGADRLVSLWPAELAADAATFYAPGQYQHRLALPPRSAWHARTAAALAGAVLQGTALPPFANPPQEATKDVPPPPGVAGLAEAAPPEPAPLAEEADAQGPATLTITSLGEHGWRFGTVNNSLRWEHESRTPTALLRELVERLDASPALDPHLLASMGQMLLPPEHPPLGCDEGRPLLLCLDTDSSWVPWEALLQEAGWVQPATLVWRQLTGGLEIRKSPAHAYPGPWRIAGAEHDREALERLASTLKTHLSWLLPDVQLSLAPDAEDALLDALGEPEQGAVLIFSRSSPGTGASTPASTALAASRRLRLAAGGASAPGLLLLDNRHGPATPRPSSGSGSHALPSTWPMPEGLDLLIARGVRCVVTLGGEFEPQAPERAWMLLLEPLLKDQPVAEALQYARQQCRAAAPEATTWVHLQGWGDTSWRLPLPAK